MHIEIENETDYALSQEHYALIEGAIHRVLAFEKVEYEVEVSVTIVTNDAIKVINKETRNIDKATDVLSFPLVEFGQPSVFQEEFDDDAFNLDTDDLVLGDIVLSIERAREQALEYGHSIEREVGFLIIHSMLHLLGYDHIDENDEKVMIERQKLILEHMNLKR